MAELHLRVLGGHAQHVGVEIAEAGRENQRGAVELDHALHGALDIGGLGDLLLLDELDVLHLLQHGGGFGMRLVVAVVVLRADIDEADRGGRRGGGAEAAEGKGGRREGGPLQQAAAGEVVAGRHGHRSPGHGPDAGPRGTFSATSVPGPRGSARAPDGRAPGHCSFDMQIFQYTITVNHDILWHGCCELFPWRSTCAAAPAPRGRWTPPGGRTDYADHSLRARRRAEPAAGSSLRAGLQRHLGGIQVSARTTGSLASAASCRSTS